MSQPFAIARHDWSVNEAGAQVQEEWFVTASDFADPTLRKIDHAVVRSIVFQQRKTRIGERIFQAVFRLREQAGEVCHLWIAGIVDVGIVVLFLVALTIKFILTFLLRRQVELNKITVYPYDQVILMK